MTGASVPTRPPSRDGMSADHLAACSTLFRPDLLIGMRVLVSGGGSGIGRATANLLTRLGATVMISGRDQEKLRHTSDDIEGTLGREVSLCTANIRDPDAVDAAMTAAFETLGGLDGLVNNAGGQFPKHALELTRNGWSAVVDTNLNGTWWMMQAAARRWRDRGAQGRIVNIVAPFERGYPQQAHLAAARSGTTYLSKSVAIEWAPLGIRVNCILPGTIATEGLDNYPPDFAQRLGRTNPLRTSGDAMDVAQAIVYHLADSGKFVTGSLFRVDGGNQLWGMGLPLGVPPHLRDS